MVLGEAQHHDEVAHLNERALKLYLRAKGYCMRAMEVRFPGIGPKLLTDPAPALAKAEKKDVPLLYWTAASWGSAIGLGVDKPDLVIDMPTVRALAERALALDETWSKGALHEMFVSLDSLPEALGGSPARAREHFARAVELQKGLSPGPTSPSRPASPCRRRTARNSKSCCRPRWPSTRRRIRPSGSSRSSSSAARARCSITSTRCSRNEPRPPPHGVRVEGEAHDACLP